MHVGFLFLSLIITQFAFSQTNNDAYKYLTKYDPPKSPNASSFERYVSVPVNYQTGQANYTLPLMNFTVDGLTVPLNLSYSSTGLKVSDVASWVGLGWNLNVGGAVTRVVKGIPDDGPFGLMDSVFANNLNRLARGQMQGLERWNYFRRITEQMADVEHDVFHYEVLGTRGSFYINKLGQCIQMPRSNIKIVFTKLPNGELDKFTITNERGDKFFFHLKEQSTIAAITNSVTGNDGSYYNSLKGSTWHLTEIETQNGQHIYFHYNHYQYYKTEKTETQMFYTLTPGVEQCVTGGAPTYRATHIKTLVDIYQLSEIYWKNGVLKFDMGAARDDLKQIDLNAQVPYLSGIALYHTPTPFSLLNAKQLEYVSLEYLQSPRLLLKNVHYKKGNYILDNSYQFNYIFENVNYTPWPSANYTQQSYNAQDYWGYYNGATSNFELLPYDAVSDFPDIDGTNQNVMYGINRTSVAGRNNRAPNPFYASYGMLEEIIYPTGGKTKFYYEGNVVRKSSLPYGTAESDVLANTLPQGTDAQNNPVVTLGGVRVKKIEFYSDPSNPVPSTVKNILYDQANVSIKFLPSYITAVEKNSEVDPVYTWNCKVCPNKYIFTLHSSSVVANPAYLVEYYNVTEHDGETNGAGQTYHQFKATALGPEPYWAPPYPAPFHFSWYSEEVKTSSQLPNGDPVLIRETGKNNNDQVPSAFSEKLNVFEADFKVSVVRNDGCPNLGTQGYSPNVTPTSNTDADIAVGMVYKWHVSLLPTENYITDLSKEKSYGPSGQVLEKVVNYEYTLNQKNRLLPRSTASLNSKGENVKTLISYPQDYFPGSVGFTSDPLVNGIVNLINKNLVGVPVEEIDIVNKGGVDYVVGGRLTTFYPNRLSVLDIYKLSLSTPVLLSSFTKSHITASGYFVYDGRYQLGTRFHNYNSENQPLEFSEGLSGIRNSYIWGYNSTYLIAEVANASPNRVAYTSFEDSDYGGWTLNSGGTLINSNVITGKKTYSGGVNKTVPQGDYIVTLWAAANCSVNGIPGSQLRVSKRDTWWRYFEWKLTNVTSIQVWADNMDEVRVYPVGSQMTTYTYEPLVGITSQTDINNNITYYEYDIFGRLAYVRDRDYNILKKYCYNYAGQQEACGIDTNPNWQNTATAVRCKAGSSTGEQEQEQKDLNVYSATYNFTRWVVIGSNCTTCPAPANWQVTGNTRCVKDGSNQNTGYQEREEKDLNTCSATYNQLRWVSNGYNTTACPPPYTCTTGNCSGANKKCINNVCEMGIKVYTSSVWTKINGTTWKWKCTYRYRWSDCSMSATAYTEYWDSSCLTGGICTGNPQ